MIWEILKWVGFYLLFSLIGTVFLIPFMRGAHSDDDSVDDPKDDDNQKEKKP